MDLTIFTLRWLVTASFPNTVFLGTPCGHMGREVFRRKEELRSSLLFQFSFFPWPLQSMHLPLNMFVSWCGNSKDHLWKSMRCPRPPCEPQEPYLQAVWSWVKWLCLSEFLQMRDNKTISLEAFLWERRKQNGPWFSIEAEGKTLLTPTEPKWNKFLMFAS